MATVVLFMIPGSPLLAAELARVEVIPPSTPTVWAGQQVTFAVELLVQGQFAGSPYFQVPEIPGAIVMKPSDRPLLGTREIEGEVYTYQRHDFVLFAQRGGQHSMPPFTVRFASRERYDRPVVEHELKTTSFQVEAKAPPGARPGEIIVSTVDLETTESWTPEPGLAKVGDAFNRTLTMKASGVPGMLLPALDPQRAEGLATYPKPSSVHDQTERGELIGERVESVTYVCEQAGTFEIPRRTLRWWNPQESAWMEKTFPAVTFEVAENPLFGAALGSTESPPAVRSTRAWLLGITLLAVVSLTVLGVWGSRSLRLWRNWQEARAAREPEQFARLLKACGCEDASAAYGQLTVWLARFGRGTTDLTDWWAVDGNPGLSAECLRLQERLAGVNPRWDGRALKEELIALRRRMLTAESGAGTALLMSLNPR